MVNLQNLSKEFVFQKDIFSSNKLSYKRTKLNEDLLKIFTKLNIISKKKINIEKFSSNNLNSQTFRFSYKKQKFIIKLEKANNISKKKKVYNFLKNERLTNKFIKPKILKNRNYFIINKKLVSIYPFISGKLYIGTKKQLFSSVREITKLFSTLAKTKKRYKGLNSFNYFSKKENNLLSSFFKNKNKINYRFKSTENFSILPYLPLIIFEWKRLKKKKFYKGPVQLSYTDIHPHNIMLKGNNVQGILDSSSIRFMPAGYSLAYGLLKLLRQYIYYNKVEKKDFNYIAKKIIKMINSNLKTNFTLEIFEDLAVSEVLRRILFIVNSILVKRDDTLNHIMPLLVRNLIECKLIFRC